ncbi:MAG: hypothetical protein GY864_03190 [Desulfobacterales bacterium]|nr:hypothetical protein [Desulfobacterales bacterium]
MYTEGGAYQNWNETTDALGKAEFLLPDVNYKFRADEGGDQVYSTVITILPGQVNSIEIDLD